MRCRTNLPWKVKLRRSPPSLRAAHNPGALEYRLLDRDGKSLIGDLQVPPHTTPWMAYPPIFQS